MGVAFKDGAPVPEPNPLSLPLSNQVRFITTWTYGTGAPKITPRVVDSITGEVIHTQKYYFGMIGWAFRRAERLAHKLNCTAQIVSTLPPPILTASQRNTEPLRRPVDLSDIYDAICDMEERPQVERPVLRLVTDS
jgi:hypothetical protein